MEFNGKWKLLHYAASKFFSDVTVSVVEDEDENALVWVVNDLKSSITAKLKVALVSLDNGREIKKWEEECKLDRFSEKPFMKIDTKKIFDTKITRQNTALYLCLSNIIDETEKKTVSSIDNTYFFCNAKQIRLKKPTIKITDIVSKGNETKFNISSDQVALYVYLSAGSIPGRFSENGFHLLNPGVKKSITFYCWDSTKKLEGNPFTVLSLRDSY